MNKLIKLFFILIASSIQMSVVPVIFQQAIIPNLALVLLFAWLLKHGFNKILPWIIISGFIYDLVFFYPIGVNIIFFLVICYIISFGIQRFLVEDKFWSFAFIFLNSVFVSFSVYYFNKVYIYMNSWNFIAVMFQKQDVKFILILSIVNLLLYYILRIAINQTEKYSSIYESKIKIK